MLNKNKTISSPEKSILIVAVITSCLTSKAVYAQEQQLPTNQPQGFSNLPLAEPLPWKIMAKGVSEKPEFKINDEDFSAKSPTVESPFQPIFQAPSKVKLSDSWSINSSVIPISYSTPLAKQESFISVAEDRQMLAVENVSNNKSHLNSVPNLFSSSQRLESNNCNLGVQVSECDLHQQSNKKIPPNLASLKDFTNSTITTKIAQSDSGVPLNPPTSTTPPTPEEIDKQITNLQQRLKTLGENTPDFIWFSSPGRSGNVPTAWGASLGDVGVGFSFQNRTRFTNTSDGGAGIGFGLGDPYKAVGFDVGININDLGLRGNESFAGRGSFDFTLHRVFPDNFRVAVGLENALVWGITDIDTSVYGVVSKTVILKDNKFKNFSRLYLNAGVGNGRFRSEKDINSNINSVGFFGSIALRVIDQMNVFTEWTGQDLNIGLSITPFSNIPVIVTPTAFDLTGNAGNGTRFGLGVGYGFRF